MAGQFNGLELLKRFGLNRLCTSSRQSASGQHQPGRLPGGALPYLRTFRRRRFGLESQIFRKRFVPARLRLAKRFAAWKLGRQKKTCRLEKGRASLGQDAGMKRFGPGRRKGQRFALKNAKKAKRFGRKSQILALRWD